MTTPGKAQDTEKGKQNDKPQGKYSVTVVTASGNDEEPTAGDATVESVIKHAFKDLDIKTPLEKFTFENEAGTVISLHDKVRQVCATTTCKIYANPKKAADA